MDDQEYEIYFRENAIKRALDAKPKTCSENNKNCLYCQAPLDKPRAYCDKDCADDHEKLLKRR